MTLTHLDLDRIEGFARVATPGPWAVHPKLARVDAFDITDPDGGTPLCLMLWPTDLRTEEVTDANAAFIAALDPTTVLSLITRIRELEGALEPFAADKLPPLKKTERDYDENGLRRMMSPMEIARKRARTALQRKTS